MTDTACVSRPRARGALPVLGVCAFLLAAGCGDTTTTVAPPPPPPEEAAPVDDLLPDELAEGQHSAFGLAIPEGMRVTSRSHLEVVAIGQNPFEDVATFVRKRVDAQDIATGPGKTIFDGVTVKEPKGGEAGLMRLPATDTQLEKVRVEVAKVGRRTRLHVTRGLVPKTPEGLNEDQRWERLGIRKDGKPVDPRKFE